MRKRVSGANGNSAPPVMYSTAIKHVLLLAFFPSIWSHVDLRLAVDRNLILIRCSRNHLSPNCDSDCVFCRFLHFCQVNPSLMLCVRICLCVKAEGGEVKR